jgi:phosphoesterase RecJ-like protein
MKSENHRNNAMLYEIIEHMKTADSWLVVSHEKPDGDTIGCASALVRLGIRLSKKVMFACPDPCPHRYSFLLDEIGLSVSKYLPDNFPGANGVLISVDTSTTARSFPNLAEHSKECTLINIDHHIDNRRYGDINWIDDGASATGEMLTELMSVSPWGMTKKEAEALYTSIVSDNGDFRFASTTVKSHDCAIKLMNAGASPCEIAEKLESTLTPGALRLWGRAMSRTDIFEDGLCALYWLEAEDFAETLTSKDDTENLVNYLLRIKGVKMAALCCENLESGGKRGGIRASIRARAPFNSRKVASVFGGGGHDLAAGCEIDAPLADSVRMLRAEMSRHVSGIPADR